MRNNAEKLRKNHSSLPFPHVYKLDHVYTIILGLRFICSHAQIAVFLHLQCRWWNSDAINYSIPELLLLFRSDPQSTICQILLLIYLQSVCYRRIYPDGEIHGNGGCGYKDRCQVQFSLPSNIAHVLSSCNFQQQHSG